MEACKRRAKALDHHTGRPVIRALVHWPALSPKPCCVLFEAPFHEYAMKVLSLVDPEHRKKAGGFLVNVVVPTLRKAKRNEE